jgi:hypothetical protein
MTYDELDASDLSKITEDQVVEAFRQSLRMDARYMTLDGETEICRETAEQREERTDAAYVLETLRSNYIANHVR